MLASGASPNLLFKITGWFDTYTLIQRSLQATLGWLRATRSHRWEKMLSWAMAHTGRWFFLGEFIISYRRNRRLDGPECRQTGLVRSPFGIRNALVTSGSAITEFIPGWLKSIKDSVSECQRTSVQFIICLSIVHIWAINDQYMSSITWFTRGNNIVPLLTIHPQKSR